MRQVAGIVVGILRAICIWCVGSAACMALLAVLTVARMLRAAGSPAVAVSRARPR